MVYRDDANYTHGTYLGSFKHGFTGGNNVHYSNHNVGVLRPQILKVLTIPFCVTQGPIDKDILPFLQGSLYQDFANHTRFLASTLPTEFRALLDVPVEFGQKSVPNIIRID
jgi:hypothetical protein